MAQNTLIDIAKLNGNDALTGLIEEVTNIAPEVATVPARTIAGTSYKVKMRLSYPAAGFRNANESRTATKSEWDNKTVECMILGGLMTVDKAVAKAYEGGAAELQALEAAGMLESALQVVGRQFYYGTNTTYSGDAKGFPGLLSLYDSTNMQVDAGGTTDNTSSSVWLVKFGPRYVQFLSGAGGMFDLTDWREELVSSVDSYVATLTSWVGLHFGHSKSVCRISGLTADSGKTLTDALIANALSKFPVGITPDVMFMSRRSAYQLQTSRSVVINAGAQGAGVGAVSPWPGYAFGIPIIVTDSISEVEAVAL